MRLKGCQKNVIMLKGTDSEIFEEAFFVLRRDVELDGKVGKSDMVNEAQRILNAHTSDGDIIIKGKKSKEVVSFAAGAVSTLLLCTIIGIILLAL
jgi:hypothetical protein